MGAETGEQYEITFGTGAATARAVVTEIGAGLRAFEVGGVPHLETFPESEHPPLGSGAVLVPWPNRVADGRWTWQGRPQQLEISEPELHNAIHGLQRKLPWTLVEHVADRVELVSDIVVQPGWPVPLRATVEYTLAERGLTVTHTMTNVGEQPVPFGLGTHPYPRAGAIDRDECRLQLAATTVLPLSEDRLLPSGPATPVAGTEFDFRVPQSLAGRNLNTPMGGCEPEADGLVHHRLLGPDGGVELWADPDFRWVQVFTPPEFLGRGAGAVAIEPMTCPPDALNSGVDLITVAPGETWTGRWGFTPLR
ncbi:MAG TPA: aldose 1-epimerase family protein [Pseudonocardiaceae bacterium]|jgi:aldose 1-epimerase|nr:aldose 1-epimerase family protein [Pseudonocardiaceae bacterium]